jgi:hypothetical protein
MPEQGLLGQTKRFVVGQPIPSHLAHHERLSHVTGLSEVLVVEGANVGGHRVLRCASPGHSERHRGAALHP